MAIEDIIWGKNRHVYGGIEPSNMLKFAATTISTGVRLTYMLPNNTIIDGHPICTVAGAVIRRRSDRYPTDEFDGDEIAVVNGSGESYYDDTTVIPYRTYYYAAFPFSTQDVYNRNPANRTAINEPGNMVEFTVSSTYNRDKDMCDITLMATLPSFVSGAVIRMDNLDYPIDENDGELYENITTSTVFNFEVSPESDYYFSAFTYNSNGNFNRNQSSSNRCYVHTLRRQWLYGYDLDTTNSDPATRITYPADVDNANFTAAGLKYDSSNPTLGYYTFDYGDWPSTPGEGFMPRPCMLKYDGVVDHYLDPNDYSKKVNGTTSSVSDKSFAGNAMVEWPKIYTKRWEDENGIYHFRCSDAKVDPDYECWCNYDINNNEIDHFYTGIYKASFETVSSGVYRLRSGSRRNESGTGISFGTSAFITAAQKNGEGWNIDLLSDRLLINDLLTMMSKSTDGQTKFGMGGEGSYSSSGGNGDKLGMFCGNPSDDPVTKTFGMEYFLSQANRLTAGLLKKGGTFYTKITIGTKDGSTTTTFNTTGAGYNTNLDIEIPSNAASGYISKCKTTPYGRFPCEVKGSSTLYECDYGNWFGPTSTTMEIAYFGSGQEPGEYNYTEESPKNGPYALVFDPPQLSGSDSYKTCVTSLSCKPTATV